MAHRPVLTLAAALLGIVGIACVHAAPFAYVSHTLSNDVSVIDTARNVVVATIPVGVGPRDVAVGGRGTPVYVVNGCGSVPDCTGPGSVSVIDPASNMVVDSIPVPSEPSALALNPAGTPLYVIHFSQGSLEAIDTATKRVTATIPIPIGRNSFDVTVNPDGTRVYVTHQCFSEAFCKDSRLSVIDAASNAVIDSVYLGRPDGAGTVVVHPSGKLLYVTAGPRGLLILDTATDQIVGQSPAGGYLALNRRGSRLG